jgi:opacity protein-like surface antigen
MSLFTEGIDALRESRSGGNMNVRKLIIGASAILVATCIQAQDAHFGFQLTGSIPQGDMGNSDNLDGKIGYGLGIHCLVPFSEGHAIVPRLDYTMYKNNSDVTVGNTLYGYDLKVNVLAVGADYNYFVSRKANDGFYVLAGLGYSSLKWEVDTPIGNYNETKGTFYLAAGLGYMFTPNVGAEIRYTHASYSDIGSSSNSGYKQDESGPALNVSLLFRF